MERIRNLDRYQKGILLILAVMLVVFTAVYGFVSSRVGFAYLDEILLPGQENGSTIYTGTIRGKDAVFTVTPERVVTFRYGETSYGPYTAKEDPTAVPEEHAAQGYMSGVEVRDGVTVIFRGGVYKTGRDKTELLLLDENGDFAGLTITATMSDGSVVDAEGNLVDPVKPTVGTILKLMEGPELTNKGEWAAWFLGLVTSLMAAVSILFAEELFRWNLAFRIRNADRAEPSDWEVASRYMGWTILTITALFIYIKGLQ